MKFTLLTCLAFIISNANYIRESGSGWIEPYPEEYATLIGIENGFSFDTRNGEPPIPEDLKIISYQEGQYGYYLVQFKGSIRTEWKEGLQAQGAKIYAYWPYNAYLVGMTTDKIEKVKSLPFIQWIGIFQPAYKINIELLSRHDQGVIDAQLYPDADLAKTIEKLKDAGAGILSYQTSSIGQIVYLE